MALRVKKLRKLRFSNGGFLQLNYGENMECLLEGLVAIFEHIGGVPTEIWFDNTRTIVTKIIKGGGRNITERFQRFCEYYRINYAIGDPFALFSVFVPVRFMWIYYDAMIILRLYLSGVAFSCLCFYTRKNSSRYTVMAGALSYVFCQWAIVNANRHPYFLNPMLYFPLIILGIEKLLRKEKPWLLIISVFLSAISNFYYFYVMVLLTVAYVAVRLIAKYKTDFRAILKMLLRIAGGSILGTMMGGVILLPVMFDFLNDARMGSGNAWHFVYPLSYYSRLLGTFFYGDVNFWLCMGYAAPVILAT